MGTLGWRELYGIMARKAGVDCIYVGRKLENYLLDRVQWENYDYAANGNFSE